MSEANPADGTDAGVTNVDIKQLLIKYDELPDELLGDDIKSDPMYVNVGPKQVGNNPAPGGSCIFIADRVRSYLFFYWSAYLVLTLNLLIIHLSTFHIIYHRV